MSSGRSASRATTTLRWVLRAVVTTSRETPFATAACWWICRRCARSGLTRWTGERVAPGATLGDFDREAQAFGLATPLGINSTTGVAGLTLGGGFGWLSRKYGLSVDNLLSADMVTADGELLRASDNDNSDLFWALRAAAATRRRHLLRVPHA